jgi:hypothetical protein
MKYSLEKIDTTQACDALLTKALKKKQTLVRKRRNLGEAIDAFRRRMDKLGEDFALVNTLLRVFTTAYQALPAGKYKAAINVKVKRLEFRQAVLEKKAYTCNVATLLVKELKYNVLDGQLSALEAYIASVQQLRATLSQAVMHLTPAIDTTRPSAVENGLSFEKAGQQAYVFAPRTAASVEPQTEMKLRRLQPSDQYVETDVETDVTVMGRRSVSY